MPIETGRIVKRKRIQLPADGGASDGGKVNVAVITQITFVDATEQYQETQFSIDNRSDAKRDIHVANVPGGHKPTDESGGGGGKGIDVERIDLWRVLDVVSHGQESYFSFNNRTIKEPPDAPPYFINHQKTHIVRYISADDDKVWVASELIDQFKVADVVDRGQETQYFLFNPPDNQSIDGLTIGNDADGNVTIKVDDSLEDISDSNIDPPWRLDPFQNIVDYAAKELGTTGGGPTTGQINLIWTIEGDPWNSGPNNDGLYIVLAGGGSPYAPTDTVLGTYQTLYAQDRQLFAGVMTDISTSGLTTVTATFADARESYGAFSFTAPSSISVQDQFPPHETIALDAVSSHASKSGSVILGKPVWWEGIFAVTYKPRT